MRHVSSHFTCVLLVLVFLCSTLLHGRHRRAKPPPCLRAGSVGLRHPLPLPHRPAQALTARTQNLYIQGIELERPQWPVWALLWHGYSAVAPPLTSALGAVDRTEREARLCSFHGPWAQPWASGSAHLPCHHSCTIVYLANKRLNAAAPHWMMKPPSNGARGVNCRFV